MLKNRGEYLNTLVNMGLLSGAKNRYDQNFTFKEKINIYQRPDWATTKRKNYHVLYSLDARYALDLLNTLSTYKV